MDKRQEFLMMVQTGILSLESDQEYRRSAGYAVYVMFRAMAIPMESIPDSLSERMEAARDLLYDEYFEGSPISPPLFLTRSQKNR